MTLGYLHAVLITYHMVLSGAASSTASVDAAGMMRRETEGQASNKADAADPNSESLFQEKKQASMASMFKEDKDGKEWASTDHVPISKYFSFAEYGQRYREATGQAPPRKKPADELSSPHKNELRYFVRDLLTQAEDFEADSLLEHESKSEQDLVSKGKQATQEGQNPALRPSATSVSAGAPGAQVPSWYHGGTAPLGHPLKFEYQAVIGRDGFEPNPTEPTCEFFGPFKINYAEHTVYLENWNLVIGTKLKRYGMGNLIVGVNNSWDDARNGVIAGTGNRMKGSYNLVSGQENVARGRGAVVDGGMKNHAFADFSSINGGELNQVDTHFAVVEGGKSNSATAQFATVGGGEGNNADGESSTAMGGRNNQALANLSAILGGEANTIPATAVSETVLGGHAVNVPTPEPPQSLQIPAGEYSPKAKADSAKELNYAAMGCKNEQNCEQEEDEEEEEEGEEDDNPATRSRTVDIKQSLKGGDNRRRTPHNAAEEDEEAMAIKAPP